MSFNRFLEKTIQKSQHCNRNWDLSKTIPDDDIATMATSVTECSSKQNRVFYKCIFITNRDVIEKIHANTIGFHGSDGFPQQDRYLTNSQTLANVLVAFVRDRDMEVVDPRTKEESEWGVVEGKTQQDEDRALGIAAGYLTLVSNLLGYDTGCCQCFSNVGEIQKHLNTDEEVLLLMGIGYRDPNRSRLEHHTENFKFASFKKNIKVEYIN